MYTSKPIKIHSKCLCILEMIQKVNDRIEDKKKSLHQYDNTKDWTAPIRLFNTRHAFVDRINYLNNVKDRLVAYYQTTLNKVVQHAS